MEPDNASTPLQSAEVPSNAENVSHIKTIVTVGIVVVLGGVIGVWLYSINKENLQKNAIVPESAIASSSPPTSNSTAENTIMDNNLKGQLEESYKKARAVIEAKGSYESFLKVFEENKDPNLHQITEAEWAMSIDMFGRAFPNLSQINYVSHEEQGDFAYYYAWITGQSPDQIMIWAYVFHKMSGEWKLTGYSQFLSTTKLETDSETQLVKDNIERLKTLVENAMKK